MRNSSLFVLLLLCQSAHAELSVIAVDGSASIQTVPDIIRIEYSVSEMGKKDAADLKEVVDRISARSIEALIVLGIDKSSISSPRLNVEQIPDYDRNDNFIGSSRTGVTRKMELELSNTTLYSQVIQALIDSGVTEIDSVEPDVSNFDELKLEALAAAAKNAEKEATLLAKTLGANIAGVHEIGKQKARRNFSMQEIVVTARKQAEQGSSVPYEFEPGTVEVSAEIYVEFNLE